MVEVKKKNFKFLILSVNCFSGTNNNGKTLYSFFRDVDQRSIYQLYFYPEYPDVCLETSYYRVTDNDVVKSVLSKSKDMGRKINTLNISESINYDTPSKGGILKSINRLQMARFLRDLLWMFEKWETDDLTRWIDSSQTDILFINGLNNFGLLKFYYKTTRRLNKKTFIYATDDYFLPYFTLSIFSVLRRFLLNYYMRKLLKLKNTKLLCINEYMKECYDRRFSTNSDILFNKPIINKTTANNSSSDKIVISYIGNLGLNRYKTISWLAKMVHNLKLNNKFIINVYSSSIESKQLKEINMYPCCHFCGKLSAEEVETVRITSDVLLIVESFDYYARKKTLLSLSTKVTECLIAKRPILAIGPAEIGTMRFLRDHTRSLCVTKKDAEILEDNLKYLLLSNNRDSISQYGYDFLIEYINKANSII